ncbi:MAG TPA: DUF5069 domain-containing protein [Candidatus Cybelea sp.]|jgi:hypothetical protein|nr:DUF5069 domain-containing protein [Candidatus Cybelea sp.]
MWVPSSGRDEFAGLVWLPRLIQKARRFAQSRARGEDLMNGYCYGDNDVGDRALLDFLKLDDATVLRVVEAHPLDEEAARELIERGGRTLEERRRFSASLRRRLFNFTLLEADEGRMAPGLRRWVLRFFYNWVVMPPFYLWFGYVERKRRTRAGTSAQAGSSDPRNRIS